MVFILSILSERFLDSIKKIGLNRIQTHDFVLTMHPL